MFHLLLASLSGAREEGRSGGLHALGRDRRHHCPHRVEGPTASQYSVALHAVGFFKGKNKRPTLREVEHRPTPRWKPTEFFGPVPF